MPTHVVQRKHHLNPTVASTVQLLSYSNCSETIRSAIAMSMNCCTTVSPVPLFLVECAVALLMLVGRALFDAMLGSEHGTLQSVSRNPSPLRQRRAAEHKRRRPPTL
eukprot:3815896-Amphidinium_carterae.1